MRRYIGFALATVAAILLTSTEVEAQAAKKTGKISVKSGYMAGNPPTAQPSGEFTVSSTVAGDQYQVLVDFGNLGPNGHVRGVERRGHDHSRDQRHSRADDLLVGANCGDQPE